MTPYSLGIDAFVHQRRRLPDPGAIRRLAWSVRAGRTRRWSRIEDTDRPSTQNLEAVQGQLPSRRRFRYPPFRHHRDDVNCVTVTLTTPCYI